MHDRAMAMASSSQQPPPPREPIPSLELQKILKGAHALSKDSVWSDWVKDYPGDLPQLTSSSLLLPMMQTLPPRDMRLPKPLRKLDPAVLRHFELKPLKDTASHTAGWTESHTVDGGPLPLQSEPSGRSSTEPGDKAEKKNLDERIWHAVKALFEIRPKDVPIKQWISDPTNIAHKALVKQLLANKAALTQMRDHFGRKDATLGERFNELIHLTLKYEEKLEQKKRQKRDSEPSEGGTKRPRSAAE